MALFNFGKKKDSPNPSDFSIPNTAMPQPSQEEIAQMRQRGMSDMQIMQQFQARGYSYPQAADAIAQSVYGAAQQGNFGQQPDFGAPQGYNPYPQAPQQPNYPMYPEMQRQEQVPIQAVSDERVQEIAEAIIDEKWQELVRDVKKVIEWKDAVESKLDHLEEQQKDLKSSLDNMQRGIFGKIADYDKSITDVGTEIKAMEKVFEKILPTLTESVNRLDRISKPKK